MSQSQDSAGGLSGAGYTTSDTNTMGALKGLACIVAAIVLNFPLLFAQEVRHRTLKTEGIKLPRTGRKVQRDAVRANSQASKKMGDIKPLYISPEKNAAFKAFEGPKLPISHQMPPVANAEAVAKHNEEVIARRGLDKDQPSKRNLNTPVKAESEDAALFIDTHSEYTLGLKSLVLVIMCPGGHDCENDVRSFVASGHSILPYVQFTQACVSSIIHTRSPLTATTLVLSIAHISKTLMTTWIFWSDIITTFM